MMHILLNLFLESPPIVSSASVYIGQTNIVDLYPRSEQIPNPWHQRSSSSRPSNTAVTPLVQRTMLLDSSAFICYGENVCLCYL